MDEHGSKIDPLRTALAAKGVELSAIFFVVFEDVVIPGAIGRQPRLTAPHGPSTGGGKMARQHITLSPIGDEEGAVVVAGWADQTRGQAELRSYEVVAAKHKERFGVKLDIPSAAYRSFLKRAQAFFHEQEFTVHMIEPSAATASQKRSSSWGLLVLLLVTTLIVGVALGIAVMHWSQGTLPLSSP